MAYSLKLVNEVLRLCQQEKADGVSDEDRRRSQRLRDVIDAYDNAYDTFLQDARPVEARRRVALQPSAVTEALPGDHTYARRHALPADALCLAEDPEDVDYEINTLPTGGQERRYLCSNVDGEINVVYIRRVEADALSPIAFTGASLYLATRVVMKLSRDGDLARDIAREAEKWRAKNIVRPTQRAKGKPVRVNRMDCVRYRG